MTRPECFTNMAAQLDDQAARFRRDGHAHTASILARRATYYRHRAMLEAQR